MGGTYYEYRGRGPGLEKDNYRLKEIGKVSLGMWNLDKPYKMRRNEHTGQGICPE